LGIRSSFGSTDDVSGWALAEAISGSRAYVEFWKALKRLTDKHKCQKPDSYFSLAGLRCLVSTIRDSAGDHGAAIEPTVSSSS
jgi:hypothetical protein